MQKRKNDSTNVVEIVTEVASKYSYYHSIKMTMFYIDRVV